MKWFILCRPFHLFYAIIDDDFLSYNKAKWSELLWGRFLRALQS